jgi:molecular chaperone HtpG
LEEEKTKVDKANKELELRKKDTNTNNVFKRVYNELESQYKPSNIQNIELPDNENETESKKNKKYLSQSLSKYNKKEQKLISKIYAIIKLILPKDMAEMVVEKIQEELSR